jgi:ribosome-associated toxin RatA of RatAB toxin-antitoxin module
MAQANASIRIPVSPDKVWQLIGGFDSLPDWLPYIPSSELREADVCGILLRRPAM